MNPRDLTCRELIEFLGQYLEEELPAEERESFDRHLAICPACVDYLASYRETIRLGKKSCEANDELPADAPGELVAAILAARRQS